MCGSARLQQVWRVNIRYDTPSLYHIFSLTKHLLARKSRQAMKICCKHLSLFAWYQKRDYQRRGAFTFHTKLYGETGMVCFEKMKRDFCAQ
jgi:hypothetical protein